MSKYKVGDELRIREWDDMEAEFGIDEDGDINMPTSFMKGMRYLCGMNFTVSQIEKYGNGIRYYSYESIEKEESGWWIILEYMLEPREEMPLYVATDTEINNLLFK